MGSTLIRGRYVITGAASGVASVIEDGAVLERDGTIVEVGPAASLAHHAVDRTLGSPGHVVLPGFVNGHHHVGLTPFQLGSPDLPLELWFVSRMAARDVDPYLDTLYSAFDMLESGITTVQHLHGWRGAPAARVFGVAERILQAYADVGMRVSYSYALRDQNRLVYEADEDFCRRLPPALGAEMREYLAAQSIPLPDHLGLFVDLWERVGRNAGPLARVQLAPGNLHWCSDEALGALRDYAEKYDVGLHMHLVETPFQRIYAERRTGTTALRHLERLGLLGPRLTLGHGVWLTEDDIALAADTGTMICHNASSTCGCAAGSRPSIASGRAASGWASGSTRRASTTTATCGRRCAWCCGCTASRAWTTGCRPPQESSRWPPPAARPPPASARGSDGSRPARRRTWCSCRGRVWPPPTSIRSPRRSTRWSTAPAPRTWRR